MGWLGGEELTGRILGGCELRQYLGSGAMSTVYLGYQSNLDREVAVKVLPQSVASVSGYSARFSKEAKILGLLEHPNIVPIYDYGIDSGISYIIMRLMTGGSLAPRLSERRLPVYAILKLTHELADALDYAHNRGVVHRDIKASNVLFDQRGRGHLADFGIAKLLDAAETQTTPTNQFGTPAYMAPELWRDEEPSPAADIYALGILTYFALAKVLPFEGSSPYALMLMHLTKRHAPIREHDPTIPEAVEEVLSRSMDKDPRQRFATSGEFADALEAAFGPTAPPIGGQTKHQPNHEPDSAQLSADVTSAVQTDPVSPLSGVSRSGRSLSRILLFAAVIVFGLGIFAAITNRPSGRDPASSATRSSAIDNATNVAVVDPGANISPTPSTTSTSTLPSVTPTPSAVLTVTPSATLPATATPTASIAVTLTSVRSSTLTMTSASASVLAASQTPTATEASTQTEVATQFRTATTVTPSYSGIPESIRSTGTLTATRPSIVVSQRWNQGDIVDICLRSRDFDAKLWLADAAGTELLVNDDHGGGVDACILQYSVAATGTYLITVGSYNSGATGNYELVLTSYAVCGQMPIAVINVLEANLRLEPNSTSQIIDSLERGRCYAIDGRTSDMVWWRVTTTERVSGWLSVATINIVGDKNSVPISLP